MNKEFVPYQQSSELKDLGFDDDSFGYYDTEGLQIRYDFLNTTNKNSLFTEIRITNNPKISAPTFSQAFRFFMENHGLDCSFEDHLVEDEFNKEIQMWDFFIYKTKQLSENKVMDFCSNNYETYLECFSREEAELKCLKELIKIVKEKQ